MKKDKNIKSYRNSSIAFALFACVIMVIVCFEIYGIKQLKDRCTYKTKAVAEEVISRKNIDYVNGELTVQTTCTVVYSYKYDRNEYLEEGSAFSKISIKKGDIVYVNAGGSKGKTGRVLEVLKEKQRAIVEGVNMVSKATKPNAKNPQGGMVKQEAPIHISNLNPVEDGKPVRVGRVEKDGKLVRVSKKTGKEI